MKQEGLNILDNIKTKIKEIENELINIRRHIHSYPELSNQEFNTMEFISNYLNLHEIKHKTKIANTGIIADILGEDKSFTIASRADMDALPIEDLKHCSYASKNKGVCHACGHDVHTAINMGIARIFSNKDKNFIPPCNIRLIFQPAEETTGGASNMIKENALHNVNITYALHVDVNSNVGNIKITDSIVNASCLDFKIKIYGKKSHGANPADGVDAIVVSANIINAIQTIISRSTYVGENAVITIGTINGGKATNVICDYVEMTGTIRALRDTTINSIINKMKKIIKNIAISMESDGEFIETTYFPGLINWKEAANIIRENAIDLLGEKNVLNIKPSLGAEDFSYFILNKPGAFFNLGARNNKKSITPNAHSGLFDVDESCIAIGLTLQIMNIYKTYLQRDNFPMGMHR